MITDPLFIYHPDLPENAMKGDYFKLLKGLTVQLQNGRD